MLFSLPKKGFSRYGTDWELAGEVNCRYSASPLGITFKWDLSQRYSVETPLRRQASNRRGCCGPTQFHEEGTESTVPVSPRSCSALPNLLQGCHRVTEAALCPWCPKGALGAEVGVPQCASAAFHWCQQHTCLVLPRVLTDSHSERGCLPEPTGGCDKTVVQSSFRLQGAQYKHQTNVMLLHTGLAAASQALSTGLWVCLASEWRPWLSWAPVPTFNLSLLGQALRWVPKCLVPTQLKSGHVSSAVGPDTLSVFFLEAQPLLKINYLISLHQKGPENVAIILTNIYIYI